jgi:hypothetical protein
MKIKFEHMINIFHQYKIHCIIGFIFMIFIAKHTLQ